MPRVEFWRLVAFAFPSRRFLIRATWETHFMLSAVQTPLVQQHQSAPIDLCICQRSTQCLALPQCVFASQQLLDTAVEDGEPALTPATMPVHQRAPAA